MGIKVNMSKVSVGWEALPTGDYLVVIKKGDYQRSKSSQKPMIKWEFWVLEPENYIGRSLFAYTSLQPHAVFAFKGLMAATGRWTDEELDDPDWEFDIEDVYDYEVIAMVVEDEYKGKPTNKIKGFKLVDQDE